MSWTCESWDARLDDFLAGRLSRNDETAFLAHADVCESCGELLRLVSADLPELGDPDALSAPDLAAGVLAATSGSACARAGDLLARRPDGTLTEREADLLDTHLDHCDDCRELARTLTWALPVVVELGEPELDAAFTYDVLRATVRSRTRKRAGVLGRLGDRFASWWGGQVRRPQFAGEVAFAATAALVLLFGTPLSPGREAPARALEVVRAGPDWALERAGDVVDAVGGLLADLGDDLEDRRNRTAPDRSDIKRHGRELGSSLLKADFDEAGEDLKDVREDFGSMWRNWRASRPDTLDDTSQPQAADAPHR